MLVHHLTRRAPKWRPARQHLPECHAQRVEIRPGVQGEPGALFGTSKFWCSDKTSWCRNGVEIIIVLRAEMKNGGNIRMAKASRGAGFADKSEASRLVVEVARVDNLECHWAAKIRIEGSVGHAHC